MTGRELILHILENGLEDEEVIDKSGKPVGMMTPEEAAEKFEVSIAQINCWLATGKIESFYIGDIYYIPAFTENPNKWLKNKTNAVKNQLRSSNEN